MTDYQVGTTAFIRLHILEEALEDHTWKCVYTITENELDDVNRFLARNPSCVNGVEYYGCASPRHDKEVPVYPLENEEGLTRTHSATFYLDNWQKVVEARTGILDDLDEYARAKLVLADLDSGETITFL